MHLKWTDQGQLASISAAGGAVAPYSDAAGFSGFAAKHLSGQERTNVDDGKRTSFYYGHDTRLDRALLADGTDIRYHYGNELMPVKSTVNGATVAEYQWADKIRLLRYRDARRGLSHDFLYADKRAPVKVIISGSAVGLYQATGISAQRLELDIQTDQVDSIRALSLPDGRPVKYIEYDSFGNVISDSRPDWQFPLGFACGLNDPWTGLIRFGFRDYDPKFGRFTARDPIGDTGGDHDLWDYCVDDPVSYNDPNGLEDRSLFRRGLAGYSPIFFGNDEERRTAKNRLHRSMKKSVEGLAGGMADITHAYTKIPTVPFWDLVFPVLDEASPKEEEWVTSNARLKKQFGR